MSQVQNTHGDFSQTICLMVHSVCWGFSSPLFQGDPETKKRVLLVGIEEPEIALHPAAAGVLLDALREAAATTQVIITSHSPDLLDDKELDPESILAVEARDGLTVIADIDQASKVCGTRSAVYSW